MRGVQEGRITVRDQLAGSRGEKRDESGVTTGGDQEMDPGCVFATFSSHTVFHVGEKIHVMNEGAWVLISAINRKWMDEAPVHFLEYIK